MITIRFPTGMTARAVAAPPDAQGDDVLAALDIPVPRGTVVLNGTTEDLDPDPAARLGSVLGDLAGLGVTMLTGGTDAGIFAVLGQARSAAAAAADADRGPLVGVVPRHLVTWPGGPTGGVRVRLEPHHSRFVLVDGHRWGDETPVLLGLSAALGRHAPCVAVVCGGGPITASETAGHVRAGRPVIVVEGSGRFADELAGAAGVTVASGPDEVVAAVLAYLDGGAG